MSPSIDKIARPDNLSWPIVERRYVFINLSLLNDLSQEATVTGIVKNIFIATTTLGNISFKSSSTIALRRPILGWHSHLSNNVVASTWLFKVSISAQNSVAFISAEYLIFKSAACFFSSSTVLLYLLLHLSEFWNFVAESDAGYYISRRLNFHLNRVFLLIFRRFSGKLSSMSHFLQIIFAFSKTMSTVSRIFWIWLVNPLINSEALSIVKVLDR